MEDVEVCILGPSDFFGEVALYHDTFRTASVMAANYGACGLINLKGLHQLTVNYPKLKKVLMMQMLHYDDGVRLFLNTALRRIDYLKDAKEETISNLAYAMKNEWVEANSIVFEPGDKSEVLFLIHNGAVDIITTMDNGTEFTIESL